MWPQPVTPCTCEAAGFCARHKCEKTYELVIACRLNWFAFEQWENGEGPCIDRMRDEIDRIVTEAQRYAELPACRHRGAEPIEHVECELCGSRLQQVPVYACTIFGKCTSRRYGSRTETMRTMPACIRCEKYEPPDAGQPPPASQTAVHLT